MRVEPPAELVNLLERLGLVTPTRVRSMHGRVRRLARDLPAFESVWVDALAQARLLTPFQAAEINAGRGPALAVGPFVLCTRLPDRGYAEEFVAQHRDQAARVRLYRITGASEAEAQQLERRLAELVARADQLDAACLLPLLECGRQNCVVWATCRYAEGPTAAQWMAHNGRFPPQVALEIVRQVLPGIEVLEKIGLAHGDVAAQNLTLTPAGQVLLHAPGLRTVVRPLESYAQADLPPEAFDYVAPERSAQGQPADFASDMFGWGCLWWQLLTGRTPLPGGTSLAKLRNAQTARIPAVERLAPDTPTALSEVVAKCLSRDRASRPDSSLRLTSELGSTSRAGRAALVACLAGRGRPRLSLAAIDMPQPRKQRLATAVAALAAILAGVAFFTWPAWKQRLPLARIRPPQATVRTASTQPSNGAMAAVASPSVDGDAGEVLLDTQLTRSPPSTAGDELLLPVDRPLMLTRLSLRPGQTVRGVGGGRPLVALPSDGISIDVEGVRFVGVDFVWDHLASSSQLARPAMLRVACHRIEFSGCSFQAPLGLKQPAAILWQQPAATEADRLALPSSKMQLTDCVLSGVGVGIDSDTVGALLIEATNVLHLGPGPLLRFTRCLQVDEPLLMTLSHVTLRGATALVTWQYEQVEDRAGEVSIRAVECAFVPAEGGGLLVCEGPESPEALLRGIRWSGQGSVLEQAAPVTSWRREPDDTAVQDRFDVEVAGLVRSGVGFAGGVNDGPEASRVIRWQVPLQSTDPPGIGEDGLALPTWWQ